uniref:Uncharacterized protein n=2 Tax=viral metagenome TaxID=1070528 RepID=A0A6M3L0D6_9ZZZZ
MKELNQKLESYTKYIKENPPGVLGDLKNGIDKERMLKLKREIESKGWLPDIESLLLHSKNMEKRKKYAYNFKRGIII